MNPKNSLRFLGTLLVALVCSCGNVGPADAPPVRPVNYIVLLDLSDRLLQPSQSASDQALIATVFAHFRKTVFEKKLVINSKDKFRVVIAPQPGVAYNPDAFMSELHLDMEPLPLGKKSLQAKAFEKSLPSTLKTLYTAATKGRHLPSDFAGCDLWKYFDQQLATDLVAGADNRLVVLTDGYMDFEDPKHVVSRGHRSTSTDFIAHLRNTLDWEKAMEREDWGLLHAKVKLPNVQVSILEISPKNADLDEAPILHKVWRKWLTEMHAPHPSIISKFSLSKSQALLQASLEAD